MSEDNRDDNIKNENKVSEADNQSEVDQNNTTEEINQSTTEQNNENQPSVENIQSPNENSDTNLTETPAKVVKKRSSKVKDSKVKETNNNDIDDNIELSLNSDEKTIETGDAIKTSELKKEEVSENISNDEEIKTESETADEKVSETSETEASKEDEK